MDDVEPEFGPAARRARGLGALERLDLGVAEPAARLERRVERPDEEPARDEAHGDALEPLALLRDGIETAIGAGRR